MERKNTILLTVIAVATLLVAVVGATFAYFTATTSGPDKGTGTTTVDTTKLANVKLTATEMSKSNNEVWPGTMNYIGTSVKAEIDGEENPAGKTYTVDYTVSGKISVPKALTQKIEWTVYKTTSPVQDNVVNCTPVTPENDGTTEKYSQTCTKSESLETVAGEGKATGSLTVGETQTEITFTDKATTGGDTNYYYIVYTYVNNEEGPQDNDQGVTITASIDSITATSTQEAGA